MERRRGLSSDLPGVPFLQLPVTNKRYCQLLTPSEPSLTPTDHTHHSQGDFLYPLKKYRNPFRFLLPIQIVSTWSLMNSDFWSSYHFKRNMLPTAEVRWRGNWVYLLDFSSLTSEYMVREMGGRSRPYTSRIKMQSWHGSGKPFPTCLSFPLVILVMNTGTVAIYFEVLKVYRFFFHTIC